MGMLERRLKSDASDAREAEEELMQTKMESNILHEQNVKCMEDVSSINEVMSGWVWCVLFSLFFLF